MSIPSKNPFKAVGLVFLLLTSAVILYFAFAFANSSKESVPSGLNASHDPYNSGISHWNSWSSPDYGVSFYYPENWRQVQYPAPWQETILSMQNKSGYTQAEFYSIDGNDIKAGIIIDSNPKLSSSLYNYVVQEFQRPLSGNLLHIQETEVGGHYAVQTLEENLHVEGSDGETIQLFLIHNGSLVNLYLSTYAVDRSDRLQHTAIFNDIIQSVSVD